MRTNVGLPVVLIGDEEVELERHDVPEHVMQRLILDHPDVLPVAELDPEQARPIPVGREVSTAAGPIDALFISPQGGITLVEAKLWRNPEARREVVGQIIDYARCVATWTYGDLDERCRASRGQSLWSLASAAGATDEPQFVDTLARNLRDGRFLLLVVGDGIRQEVEEMAAYLQNDPRLHYHLALVELRVFRDAERGLTVAVPSIVARTAEVTRAVVRVEVAPEAKVDVSVTVPQDDSVTAQGPMRRPDVLAEVERRAGTAPAEFLRGLLESYDQDPRFVVREGNAASVVLKVRNPRGENDFNVLVFWKHGAARTGWLEGQALRAGLSPERLLRFPQRMSQIFGIPIHATHADTLAGEIPLDELEARWPEVAAEIELLADAVDAGPAGLL